MDFVGFMFQFCIFQLVFWLWNFHLLFYSISYQIIIFRAFFAKMLSTHLKNSIQSYVFVIDTIKCSRRLFQKFLLCVASDKKPQQENAGCNFATYGACYFFCVCHKTISKRTGGCAGALGVCWSRGAKFSVSQSATGSPQRDGPKQSGPFFSPTSSPTGRNSTLPGFRGAKFWRRADVSRERRAVRA